MGCYQYQDLQQYHHHRFLVIAIVITSSILGALLHCYLYAVQGPQATVIPLLLAHFTGYKEAIHDDADFGDGEDEPSLCS